MKKWTKIVVGAVAVMLLVIGAAAWRAWPSREPMYKGRGVREYLYDFKLSNVGHADAVSALSYFGTNAVPYIRALLRVRDSQSRRACLWVASKVPRLKLRVWSADAAHAKALDAYLVILANGYWGAERAACASEVRDLTNDPVPYIRSEARVVFADIIGFQDDR
jgi:hypothetical protein